MKDHIKILLFVILDIKCYLAQNLCLLFFIKSGYIKIYYGSKYSTSISPDRKGKDALRKYIFL